MLYLNDSLITTNVVITFRCHYHVLLYLYTRMQ